MDAKAGISWSSTIPGEAPPTKSRLAGNIKQIMVTRWGSHGWSQLGIPSTQEGLPVRNPPGTLSERDRVLRLFCLPHYNSRSARAFIVTNLPPRAPLPSCFLCLWCTPGCECCSDGDQERSGCDVSRSRIGGAYARASSASTCTIANGHGTWSSRRCSLLHQLWSFERQPRSMPIRNWPKLLRG